METTATCITQGRDPMGMAVSIIDISLVPPGPNQKPLRSQIHISKND